MEQLVTIMDSYRNWKTQEQAGDHQMVVNDNPHSPELPIPVASTPAAGRVISEPPTSSPELLPSPIHPPGPSTTLTAISNPNDVQASRAWPLLGFTDIVKRRFGTDSVYCNELWQPVLATRNELNQTQRSKMMCILGKLNEDVSSSTC